MIGTSGGMVCENGGAIYKDGYNDNRMVVLGDINKGKAAYDFLVQEFNREANTVCSKANDVEITNTALLLKCEIEKIREQIQNIE